MSASRHLSAPHFFHGTKANFAAGELIEPGHATGWTDTAQTSDHRSTHVYASKSLDDAAYFADMARNPDPPERGADGRMTVKPSAFGTRHVYEVEPTGRMMRDPNEKAQPWYDPAKAVGFRSRQPLRVVRKVASWEPGEPWTMHPREAPEKEAE